MHTSALNKKNSLAAYFGFTMLEIIFVLGIFVIITGVILPIFIHYNRLSIAQSDLADVQINNVFAMNAINKEVQAAKNVLSSKTINSTLYTTNTSTIVLEYPVFNTSQELVSGVSDYGAFFLNPSDNTQLIFDFEADAGSAKTSSQKTVANFIDSFIIRFDKANPADATNVTVFLTTKKSSSRDIISITQTSSFTLRNK